MELDNVSAIFIQIALGHVKLRQLDVALIIFKHVVSGRRLESLEGRLNRLALRPEEHLHLGCPAQNGMLRQLQQELLQVVLALLHEKVVHLTLGLLGRNRWNEQARISLGQLRVEDEELGIATQNCDGAEAVVTTDDVLSVF